MTKRLIKLCALMLIALLMLMPLAQYASAPAGSPDKGNTLCGGPEWPPPSNSGPRT